MKHHDAWIKKSDDEKEAELIRAEKYWDHHDKHGSSLKAIRERAKLYPEGGIPMRPLPKKYRHELRRIRRIIAKRKGDLSFLSPELYKQVMEAENDC